MSDRTIQLALLVVVICVLASIVVSLIRHPSASSAPELATAMSLIVMVIGGLLALLARGHNGNGGGPRLLK